MLVCAITLVLVMQRYRVDLLENLASNSSMASTLATYSALTGDWCALKLHHAILCSACEACRTCLRSTSHAQLCAVGSCPQRAPQDWMRVHAVPKQARCCATGALAI